MMRFTRRLLLPAILFVAQSHTAPADRLRQADARLSLAHARAYMLDLINQDRAATGLPGVAPDDTANVAAQKHAEEMASGEYMSHHDKLGRLPDQRYTEAGGVDSVLENVYFYQRFARDAAGGDNPVTSDPTFTKQEIQDIESAYFNEFPPYDGHRKNILVKRHTHVGIGLARAGGPDGALANCQEFVNHWADIDPIARTVSIGSPVAIGGRTFRGVRVTCITLARSPLPTPMTATELNQTHGYKLPQAFAAYVVDANSARRVRTDSSGRFKATILGADIRMQGLYHIRIWARLGEKEDVSISSRTITVK